MRPSSRALLLGLLAVLLSAVSARIHRLSVSKDSRFAFSIESFGFLPGGRIDLKVSNVEAFPKDVPHVMGFVVYPTVTEARVAEQVDALVLSDACALDTTREDVVVVAISDPATWAETSVSLEINRPGLWDVLFTQCSPHPSSVSFTLDLTMVNPGPNYLSAGEAPLPWMYFAVALAFVVTTGAWVWNVWHNRSSLHKLHHLITALYVLNFVTLVSQSIMYHFIAVTGHSTGWNVAFYIFAFARGCVLIVAIALVGSGWLLLRPFLQKREKKVLMFAIPFQVLNNIAIIYVDEAAPGSISFSAWVTVLHVADVLASCAVIMPVYWSIKHLKQAQEADAGDEKAAHTLARLEQFRAFYSLTLVYLYVTRVVVYLLEESLPYNRLWISPFFSEVADLIFLVYLGFRFRPSPETAAYLQVPDDDEDEGAGGARGGAASDGEEGHVTRIVMSSSEASKGAPSQTLAADRDRGAAADTDAGTRVPSAAVKHAVAIGDDDEDEEAGLVGGSDFEDDGLDLVEGDGDDFGGIDVDSDDAHA